MAQQSNDSQKNNQFLEKRDLYLERCLISIEAFFNMFKNLHEQEGFEPSLEIDKDIWISKMQNLFKYIVSVSEYRKPSVEKVHMLAAMLFFTKIKQHTPDSDKGLPDGNKRSAVLATIIHYHAYRIVVENIKDDKIDLCRNANEMYDKAKEVASLDSQTINDDEEIAKLEKWFSKAGTKGFKESLVDSLVSFFKPS